MHLFTKEISSTAIKITLINKTKEIGRGYLYLISNDLHELPYGLLEDIFIHHQFRGRGNGGKIVQALLEEARKRNCYKVIGTSRFSRENVHEFYRKLGFREYGKEFRMDL